MIFLQLKLEQLLNHVQLAELPVDGSRFRQGVEQRRVQLVSILEMLERTHALQKLRVQNATQSEMQIRLRRGVLARRYALLQGFDDALPVMMAFQLIQTLL